MVGNPVGLNPQDIVNVQVSLSPGLATAQSQSIPLIVGPSAVIDQAQRVRTYTGGAASLPVVAEEFGNTSPEYLCAQTFLSRTPTAQVFKIGRWVKTNAPAILNGGAMPLSAQAITNFNGISNGSFTITYGGSSHNVTGVNLTTAATLNDVATLLTTAITSGTVAWDPVNLRFTYTTSATGSAALTAFSAPEGTGTDLSVLLYWQSTQGGSVVAGANAETPLAATIILRAIDKTWYYLKFTTTYNGVWSNTDATLTPTALVAVSGFVEACTPPTAHGITSNDVNCLIGSNTTNIMYSMQQAVYKRTTVYYSSSNAAVDLEEFAKFAIINYNNSNVATIAMFDSLPGVVPETLTEAQAAALQSFNGNVYVNYSNGVAITQNGFMSSGNYFDEIHSTDAFASTIQNDMFNTLIAQSASYKIPQTDAGMNVLTSVVYADGEKFVNAGVIGQGLVWNGPPVGVLKTGQTLPKGIYVYVPPIVSQTQQERQTRQAPLMQVCITLSGAVQGASAIINVQR